MIKKRKGSLWTGSQRLPATVTKNNQREKWGDEEEKHLAREAG